MRRSSWLAAPAVVATLAAIGLAGAEPVTNPPRAGLVVAASLVPLGTFRLPQRMAGSQWGFGNYAGCCGLGPYVVVFNPDRKSLYVSGHPYEQRIAEFAVPTSLAGSPIAVSLSQLVDPLEGKIGSINPGDPNTKIIAGGLVYKGRLYIGGYAYYDGAGLQKKSEFSRPTDLGVTGQVVGPVTIGSAYPGWVDKLKTLIPDEWQGPLGGPALTGGAGGAINSLQSWGPSVSVYDPSLVGVVSPVPATLVLGYPMDHPMANTSVANALWSQTDVVSGVVAIGRSLLFFGTHGMGAYCYGPGTSDQSLVGKTGRGDLLDPYCYDPDNGSKGVHGYPYRSQVWAYDISELVAVKKRQKEPYAVLPYAIWEFDPSFTTIQGAAFDPATRHLFVSQVGGDRGQPLIHVYTVQ